MVTKTEQSNAWIQAYAKWLYDVGCIVVEEHKSNHHTVQLELRANEDLEPRWRVRHLYQNKTVFEDVYTNLRAALLHFTQIKGYL